MRDRKVYPEDPNSFNPDRFLLDGKLNPAIPRPDAFFGFGRRCVSFNVVAGVTDPVEEFAPAAIWPTTFCPSCSLPYCIFTP